MTTNKFHQNEIQHIKNDERFFRIEEKLNFIHNAIIDGDAISKMSKFTQAQSPIMLTKEGIDVATHLNMFDTINKNWDAIMSNIDENVRDKNAYDIQQYCIDTAQFNADSFIDATSLRKIKDYAYLHGHPLLIYLRVAGIIIRDKYFETKGMSVFEADEFDPSKKQDSAI